MNFKIISPQKLKSILAKKKHQKVVFTNGCFDLLHAGHVSYLSKAKKLGDILVVALNSDASVRKIKGPKRPLVPLKYRAQVIAALACVDYVTAFSEPTPLKLITYLKPDRLVKGADWKQGDIVGASVVRSHGGSIHTLRYLSGHSTTKLIEQMIKRYP
ncbi:MAG: D-glycero-beta-D-manno-heptose 1-phosphate adenylyltransferase [Deltaproteobacteria bacterium]|nr:D-glycero-beta-D-manno-heptose 1-phosphate adenylyltransferase [Deltaproteobacteria bacterium]